MKIETKATLQAVIVSLLSTSILTGLISGALFLINGMIVVNILLTLSAILIIGYLFNLYTIQQFNRFLISKQVEIDKEAQKTYFDIECCKCGRINSVRINFEEDMTFKCEECETSNKVFYTFKTGLITDIPKNTNVVELISEIVDNKDAYEQSR
jgi:phage FluMu protein Com